MAAKSASKTKNDKKNPKSRRRGLSWNLRCTLCLLPSIVGITFFFVIPFARMLYYSLINNQFQRKFVWLDNYIEIITNHFFQLAVKNSLLLILIGVPLLMLVALAVSLFLSFSMKKFPILRDAFVFPMLVPTAAVVLIWQQFFGHFDSGVPIYLLFIWKNLGICIILLTSALTTLDPETYEAARMDGARPFTIHTRLSLPMIAPAIFFTVLLSIMNSFRIFKESYLYYATKYPPDYGYTLQFYLNNNFLKFNYQKLASSSILTALLVLAIVAVGFSVQRRYNK